MIGAGRFLYESWRHLSARRGQLLAKGTAFAALFSLFGALATGFTLFALLVGNDSTLYDQLLAGVAEGLPGLLKTPQDPGGAIDPDTLIQSDAMSVGGVIGLLVMLWGGLGWIDALREGVRSMYDAPKAPANIAVKKAWDVLMLALVGLGVVSSAVAGLVASSLAGPVLDAVGPSDGRFGRLVVRVLVFVAVAAVDTLLMWLILRRMSRVEIPWGDLWPGAVFGAVAIGLLKHFAGFLLARTGGNPILAHRGVVRGLDDPCAGRARDPGSAGGRRRLADGGSAQTRAAPGPGRFRPAEGLWLAAQVVAPVAARRSRVRLPRGDRPTRRMPTGDRSSACLRWPL